MKKIKSILSIFFILAVIVIAIAGTALVLDVESLFEIKNALYKTIGVLGILATMSIVGIGIIKLNE